MAIRKPIADMAAERQNLLQPIDPELWRCLEAKVFWRIVPVLFVAYVISFLDRVNVGFAALQMNKQLGFTPVVFSLIIHQFSSAHG